MNSALLTAESMVSEPNVLMVVGLGIGTVFVGLIALVFVCSLLGTVIRLVEKPKAKEKAPAASIAASADDLFATDRGTFIAAVSAAIAEESGTDASGIRIVSVKKL